MKTDAVWIRITAQKEVARQKLRELPWREKLRLVDAMRERQEMLRARLRQNRSADILSAEVSRHSAGG